MAIRFWGPSEIRFEIGVASNIHIEIPSEDKWPDVAYADAEKWLVGEEPAFKEYNASDKPGLYRDFASIRDDQRSIIDFARLYGIPPFASGDQRESTVFRLEVRRLLGRAKELKWLLRIYEAVGKRDTCFLDQEQIAIAKTIRKYVSSVPFPVVMEDSDPLLAFMRSDPIGGARHALLCAITFHIHDAMTVVVDDAELGFMSVVVPENFLQVVYSQFLQDIQRGNHVGICANPSCGKVFPRKPRHKQTCSTRCGYVVRKRRERGKKKERTD